MKLLCISAHWLRRRSQPEKPSTLSPRSQSLDDIAFELFQWDLELISQLSIRPTCFRETIQWLVHPTLQPCPHYLRFVQGFQSQTHSYIVQRGASWRFWTKSLPWLMAMTHSQTIQAIVGQLSSCCYQAIREMIIVNRPHVSNGTKQRIRRQGWALHVYLVP